MFQTINSSQRENEELKSTVQSLEWKLKTQIEENSTRGIVQTQQILDLRKTNNRLQDEIRCLRQNSKYLQGEQEENKDACDAYTEIECEVIQLLSQSGWYPKQTTETMHKPNEAIDSSQNEKECEQTQHPPNSTKEWDTEKVKLMEDKEKVIKSMQSEMDSLKQQIRDKEERHNAAMVEQQADFALKLESMEAAHQKELHLVGEERAKTIDDLTKSIREKEVMIERMNRENEAINHKLSEMQKAVEAKLAEKEVTGTISISSSQTSKTKCRRSSKKAKSKTTSSGRMSLIMRQAAAAQNDRIPCPYCNRRFGKRIAPEHIKCCDKRPKSGEEDKDRRVKCFGFDSSGVKIVRNGR